MSKAACAVQTFPSTRIPSHSGGLPVEIVLVAQLGAGGGDRLIDRASARQRGHETFVDALEEPSARLGAMDLEQSDTSSLYSFSVGHAGHPFHRHAGRRVFTAISGSAGVQLRFSTASDRQIAEDPHAFVSALHYVDVPADCLFTVRFGGGTWHQFVPQPSRTAHPALFALSCHPDELDGNLSSDLRERIQANQASIPALTEVLPQPVRALLESAAFDAVRIPKTSLSLGAAPGSRTDRVSRALRRLLGRLRARVARTRAPVGFLKRGTTGRQTRFHAAIPSSLLLGAAPLQPQEHADMIELVTAPGEFPTTSATTALAFLLEAFVQAPPAGVARLMAIRNRLVAPLGLRTSTLGCPVSSLLSTSAAPSIFQGRFPVLAQRSDATDSIAEVVLGADDKHLTFRSCVVVERLPGDRVRCMLGTRVRTLNAFGRLYMALIGATHRRYIAPTLLRYALDHATRRGPDYALMPVREPVGVRADADASLR